MAEYIDREALLVAFSLADYPWTEFEDAWEMVQNIPSADVAPVKHARWMMRQFGCGVCSNCHRQDHIDPLATHCRYCGATMDGEE